ncbi:hypothetical protein RND81_13G030700 [Saponaria officinalis]|uniref:Jacalin-type lectin domain-containing protein n=1 Tax=Saponaria officinalis TaxID=3572 RepID=A0AAW1GVH4_SAPOF
MAENNLVITNNTTNVLIPQENYFWSGTPVSAPGRIPPRSTAQGKLQATTLGALKFATAYIDSVEQLPTTSKFIAAFDIAAPQEFGPYGTQSAKNYSITFGPDESIKEVIVRHGFIVDAIGFVVADQTGETSTKLFGGNSGDQTRILLQSNEYITQISGTYGKYAYSSRDSNVATLSIHTNLKQYGPYGRGELVQNPSSFTSPTGSVVGFFGRHSNYVESIGVYLSTNATSKAYAESGPIGGIDWNVVEARLGLSKSSSVVFVDNILGSKVEATAHENGDAAVVISHS